MIAGGCVRASSAWTKEAARDVCGREFDETFLNDLPPGTDACAERGNFTHAFMLAYVFGSARFAAGRNRRARWICVRGFSLEDGRLTMACAKA